MFPRNLFHILPTNCGGAVVVGGGGAWCTITTAGSIWGESMSICDSCKKFMDGACWVVGGAENIWGGAGNTGGLFTTFGGGTAWLAGAAAAGGGGATEVTPPVGWGTVGATTSLTGDCSALFPLVKGTGAACFLGVDLLLLLTTGLLAVVVVSVSVVEVVRSRWS